MKKFVAILMIIAICVTSVMALDFEVYAGGGIQMAEVEGFKNIRLSDYESFGSNEGSLLLGMAGANGSGMPFTITLGGQAELVDNLFALIDFGFGSMDITSSIGNFNIGAKYYLLNDVFRFGIGAKCGFYNFNLALGAAQILPGTTPPVILSEGRIYNGFDLNYTVYGVNATPFVEVGLMITDSLGININAGYNKGFSTNSEFSASSPLPDADPIIIDVATTHDFYEARTDAFVHTTIDPQVSIDGVFATVSVTYRL